MFIVYPQLPLQVCRRRGVQHGEDERHQPHHGQIGAQQAVCDVRDRTYSSGEQSALGDLGGVDGSGLPGLCRGEPYLFIGPGLSFLILMRKSGRRDDDEF